MTTLFVASSQVPPVEAGPVAPPWSLTASDGSGLALTRVDARAVVEGPLAFTELHLYFHNPEARTREGTFSITLPTGAAVSRFAMESGGQFLEAEVVEKQLARRTYEDFLHRKQDPALLEKAAGNQFSARVFPIPGGADKHIVVAYSQEVTPGHYALPLRGLARSERVDVRVQVRGKTGDVVEQTLSQRNWTPDRDVVVDAAVVGAPAAIAAGPLVATRLSVALPDGAAPPASVTVLVDTSASRALGFAAEARAVRELIDALARRHGGALPVQVLAYDQVTAPLYDGRADGIGAAGIEQALALRGALGASDLGQALAYLAGHAPKSRVIVVTDGVVTAGAEGDALPGLARQLAAHGVDRIDVALIGGIRDDQMVRVIARAGLPHAGAILDLDQGAAEVARRIGLAVRTNVAIAADGASWVFPRTVEAAQSGDEVTVFVRRAPAARELALTIAGVRTVLSPVAVTPALLGRAVAGAEIAELDRQLVTSSGAAAQALRDEIVRRSVAARVVSSQTAMLVLESDADYARYGIDRRGLAEILAIGPSGVELLHRAAPVQIAAPVAPAKPAMPKASAEKKANRQAHHEAQVRGGASHEPEEVGFAEAEAGVEGGVEGGVVGGDLAGVADVAVATAAGGARATEMRAVRDERSPVAGKADSPAPASAVAPRTSPPAPAAATMPAPPPPPSPSPSAPRVEPARSRADLPEGTPVQSRGRRSEPVVERAPAAGAAIATDDDGMEANRRTPALQGPLAEIERALAAGRTDAALGQARAWHDREPGDVLALIGLGDALEAKRDLITAARVYGSIIDLYPARADFRRFAGERLERIGQAQRALILDTYRRAVEQRPDHLTGHRLLAYALVRDGQYAAAFAAILDGIDRHYPENRFAGAERVLKEDVGMIGAAYIAHVPGVADRVRAELGRRGLELATRPSTLFLMYWETDGNDVDFHIRDARGGHAWYSHKQLASGGELYADITTGYGPECFAIPGTPSAGPYQLSINYYSQGPMGYGMGLLQIQSFDGKGNLQFEDRPYVIMTDHAFVDLGSYRPR